MEAQNNYTNSMASALKQLQSRVVRFCINHIWSFIWAAVLILWAHLVCDYSKLSSFDKIQFVLINCIGGPFASVYFIHAVVIFFCRPIKRDWILSKGRYLTRVILFVLSVPIMLTFWVSTINNTVKCCEFDEGIDYAQIMYVGEMYGDGINNEDECPSRTSSNADSSLCDRCGAEEHSPSLLWMIFYHFVDPGNQHTTLSYWGRVIAGVSAGLGVLLLNGLLVSVIVGWFDSKREKWTNGDARYVKYLGKRNPYVIIGGGDIDVHIVKSIFQREKSAALKAGVQVKYPYIIIQTMSNVEELRNNIYSMLDDESQQRHVVIYRGDRTSKSDVDDLNIATAREIYILGETNNHEAAESMHDTYNMRCLELISDIRKPVEKESDRPKVYVMFEYQTTFSVYQFSNISENITEKVDFRPMNFYELWAFNVFVDPDIKRLGKSQYIPLEGKDGISADSEEFVHLIIAGMSRMGVALGIGAAHLAHYPNFVNKKKRTRITFISPNMEQERNFFMGRFKAMFQLARQRYIKALPSIGGCDIPHIYSDEKYGNWYDPLCHNGGKDFEHLGKDFIDVEWEFIDGSVENPVIQQYIIDASENNAKLTVAMCQSEPNVAVASALYLPRQIFRATQLQQVLVYQRYDDSLFSTLSEGCYETPFNGKIKPFGMVAKALDISLIEERQRVGKYVGKAYDFAQDVNEAYNAAKAKGVNLFESRQVTDEYVSKASKMMEGKYDKTLSDYYYNCNWFNSVVSKKYVPKALDYKEEERAKEGLRNMEEKFKEIKKPDGKTKTAKWWSGIYSANMLWVRRRCVKNDAGIRKCDANTIMLMAEVEHNRWNTEQLLMSYEPLSVNEQEIFRYSESQKGEAKKRYKSMMKHPNICSYDRLKEIDGSTINNDVCIVAASDYIYERINGETSDEEPRNS